MTERKILYICEGLVDEPAFLGRMMEKVHPNIPYSIFPYKTTIHTLSTRLKKEYSDFDNGESDIQLILREMEPDTDRKAMLSGSFTDIILVFDFDPHHDNPDFETVERMLKYFTDSSDMGKLYINYPMMQSYKHFKSFPDPGYLLRIASPRGYKELVGQESCLTLLSKFNQDTFIRIAIHNLRKIMYILQRTDRLPEPEEYLELNWEELYLQELDMYWQNDCVHVINTLSLSIIDYNPTAFFNLISRHKEKFS